MEPAKIERFVSRWFVLSILTARYSGSAESWFDFDIKQVNSRSFEEFLTSTEEAELSDTYWNVGLPQDLESSSTGSPHFNVFLASLVKANEKGFLSRDITVGNLITYRGDIHHLFPKHYLKQNNLGRGQYNQVANYVYMQQEINIKVGNKSPNHYFQEIVEQCNGGSKKYGSIESVDEFHNNLKAHCIPTGITDMSVEHYNSFLAERRKLMAEKIKSYYLSL